MLVAMAMAVITMMHVVIIFGESQPGRLGRPRPTELLTPPASMFLLCTELILVLLDDVYAPRIVVDIVDLLLVLQLALADLHQLAQWANLTLHGLVFESEAILFPPESGRLWSSVGGWIASEVFIEGDYNLATLIPI
jgi:hypothetical protein